MNDKTLVLEEEKKLMLAYQQDDQQAFSTLYQRYADKVYSFILKKGLSPEIAAEIYQAVFERIHSKKHLYRAEMPVGAWIFTVTKNIVNDYFRQRKSEFQGHLAYGAHLDLTTSGDTQAADRHLDLATLEDRERQVVEMRYIQEHDFSVIAKSLNLKSDHVRKIISRALGKLRQGAKK